MDFRSCLISSSSLTSISFFVSFSASNLDFSSSFLFSSYSCLLLARMSLLSWTSWAFECCYGKSQVHELQSNVKPSNGNESLLYLATQNRPPIRITVFKWPRSKLPTASHHSLLSSYALPHFFLWLFVPLDRIKMEGFWIRGLSSIFYGNICLWLVMRWRQWLGSRNPTQKVLFLLFSNLRVEALAFCLILEKNELFFLYLLSLIYRVSNDFADMHCSPKNTYFSSTSPRFSVTRLKGFISIEALRGNDFLHSGVWSAGIGWARNLNFRWLSSSSSFCFLISSTDGLKVELALWSVKNLNSTGFVGPCTRNSWHFPNEDNK